MFYQIFLSPKVKRWAIITYKHGIYEELQHELPNNKPTQKKKKKDLRKLVTIRKLSKTDRMIGQRPDPPPKWKLSQ